jgi:SNF2 family DNA or RNA helicase
LAKKDRERVLGVISKINSSFRWCLSGTPKHADFDDISSLARLLGVHLGVDEVLPGVKLNKKYLTDKETTGLESLSHYLENRSLQWHHRRHELGQAWLTRFVRQNIAEIDEIPFEDHTIVVTLPPAERAIYMELETHLKSLEMNNKNAQKSKRKSTGDRESRMQKILQDSETGEEALLKCCSHFNMSTSSTALETIDDIIKLRESEERNLEKEMTLAVAAAYRQRRRVLDCQPDWMSVTMTGKGEVQDALGVYLNEVDAKKSVPHGADEEINDRVDKIVKQAECDFDANPNMRDSFFNTDKVDESDEEVCSTGKKTKCAKLNGSKKQSVIDEVKLFEMKQALRNHMHLVRSLAKELCGRIRSLRYIQYIRHFQWKGTSMERGLECNMCQKERLEVDDVGVLSSCGHSGCLSCLRKQAGEGHCIVANCSARVSAAHIIAADKLGLDREDASGGHFGRKLTAVVEKVKDIIEKEGDRLLIFCQFDDLKDKVKEALTCSDIKSLEVKGTVTQQISTLSIFQKDKPDKSDPRVLLLKMDDEQSAGLNLTVCN